MRVNVLPINVSRHQNLTVGPSFLRKFFRQLVSLFPGNRFFRQERLRVVVEPHWTILVVSCSSCFELLRRKLRRAVDPASQLPAVRLHGFALLQNISDHSAQCLCRLSFTRHEFYDCYWRTSLSARAKNASYSLLKSSCTCSKYTALICPMFARTVS